MIAFGNLGLSQLNTVVGQAGYLNFPMGIDIPYVIVYILLLLTVVFACRNSASLLDRFAVSSKTLAVSSILFLVAFLCLSRQSVFIYFNF